MKVTSVVAADHLCEPQACECNRRGVESVEYIRCVEHRGVGQYNTACASGAECAACEVEPLSEDCATLRSDKDELESLIRVAHAALDRCGVPHEEGATLNVRIKWLGRKRDEFELAALFVERLQNGERVTDEDGRTYGVIE